MPVLEGVRYPEELPESDVTLVLRVLTGILDCDDRFAVLGEGVGTSCGGDNIVIALPAPLGTGASVNPPFVPKSLLERLCMPAGLEGTGLSRSIPSSEGVTPMYQAVGEDGETFIIK